MPPLTREERASKAKVEISSQFNPKQQAFLDFVLSHYVNVGVLITALPAPLPSPARHTSKGKKRGTRAKPSRAEAPACLPACRRPDCHRLPANSSLILVFG